MTEQEIIKKIEYFGSEYCRTYLSCWDAELLQKEWWEALKFFFTHAFMRGRRDELSQEYYCFATEILEECFSIQNKPAEDSYNRLREMKHYYGKNWILDFKNKKRLGHGNPIKHLEFSPEVADKNPLVKLLTTRKLVQVQWDKKVYKKEIALNNSEDVMMILDALLFISNEEKKNLYNYLKNTLETKGVPTIYFELISIRAVGDKIASFIIRDIGLMNVGIINDHYEMAFPIDTWVAKMAHQLGCNSDNHAEIKEYMLNKCRQYNMHPLKVAAGLWMWGFNGLEVEN
jgi:hypothetical protein